jgi:D-alanyl-lipoteichoic acid acyltransferase DltB (MBOAT superfamily)
MYFIPVYILILFFTILIDYAVGIWLENTKNQKKKKNILWLSIIANVGILAVFKYFNFFIDNLNYLFNTAGINIQPINHWEILLPIGLSFHTFQAMSYTIEVYRGNFKAEKHLGIYALYVMYYPQLVAGPIERPQNVLPQFHKIQHWDYSRISGGLQLMLWGLLKKVVIADRLSIYVDDIYKNYSIAGVYEVLFASVLFSIQIYCDFSGYSDIALGSSKVMGIELMQNFNRPYAASSISGFWSRWHISLSTWFKDYVYIPLGGNRVTNTKWITNILIIFLLSGFWHGASWTFVIWGLLHAVYTVIEIPWIKITQKKFPNLVKTIWWKYLGTIIVFILVTIAWVLFRAENFTIAKSILHKSFYAVYLFLFYSKTYGVLSFLETYTAFIYNSVINMFMILSVFFLLLTEWKLNLIKKPLKNSKAAMLMAILIVLIALFGVTSEGQFIYFQF